MSKIFLPYIIQPKHCLWAVYKYTDEQKMSLTEVKTLVSKQDAFEEAYRLNGIYLKEKPPKIPYRGTLRADY
jgi:hypothetical protein